MKENIIKASAVAIFAGFAAYFGELAVPLIIMIAAMAIDYITGMAGAWITRSFSSRTGITGIVKKVLYLVLVAAAMILDWVIKSSLAQAGIDYGAPYFVALLVIIWLIINEIISILENLAEAGVPMPAFLAKLVKHLKVVVEEKADTEEKTK